jgi:hypothetical protein
MLAWHIWQDNYLAEALKMRNLVSEFSAPIDGRLAAPDPAADARITIDPMGAAPDDTPLVSALPSA